MTVRVATLETLPDELGERFLDRDGVIWTGAGVSARLQDFGGPAAPRGVGVPSAGALRAHLAKRLNITDDREGLDDVAQRYVQKYGRDRLDRLLGVYRARRAAPPPFYDRVARLPGEVDTFITTNYDPFLELALRARDPVVVVRARRLEQGGSTNRTVVYKPHGDAVDPSGCVVTHDDYQRWDTDTGKLPEVITQLLLQKTVVAIGHRARDTHFQKLLLGVGRTAKASGVVPSPLYVVVPEASESEFARYIAPEYNLVLVPATGDAFLDWLTARIEAVRRDRAAARLSGIVDQPAVAAARAALAAHARAFTAAPASDDARADAAALARERGAAHERLAAALKAEDRWAEALLEQARAVRQHREAGDLAQAESLFISVIKEAVEVRRDASLATRLRAIMRPRSHGIGFHPEPDSEPAGIALATAHAMEGVPGRPPHPFLEVLTRRAEAVPTGDEGRRLQGVLAWLRAEDAVTRLDFPAAGREYASAAALTAGSAAAEENRIRSLLFGGLGPRAEGALAELLALSIPDAVEDRRLSAIGWLATIAGRIDEGVTAFETVARRAVGRADPGAAATAFRDAEWAAGRRRAWEWRDDPHAAVAGRLQRSVAPDHQRRTVDSLLDRANEALVDGDTHDAVHYAYAAQRLAFAELSPSGVERSQLRLGRAWTARAAEGASTEAVFWAAYHLGTIRSDILSTRVEALVAPLRDALRNPAVAPAIPAIARALATEPVDYVERTGMLLLLGDLAEVFPSDVVHEHVTQAVLAGLTLGWGMGRTNAADAALRLIGQVAGRFEQGDAAAVLDALVSAAVRAGWSVSEDLLIAIAQVADRAKPSARQVAELAAPLLDIFEQSDAAPRYEIAVGATVVLAVLAPNAERTVRDRIMGALEHEARAGRWRGLEVLAGSGEPLAQDLLDEYLAQTARVIESMIVTADPNQFGFGFSFGSEASITFQAGERASSESVRRSIDAALALLPHDGQWARWRALWVFYVGRLLRGRSDELPRVLPTLLRLASGRIDHPGELEDMGHAGSAVAELQSVAMRTLGALLAVAAPSERTAILATIDSAAASSAPDAREAAVRAAGEALAALASDVREAAGEESQVRQWALQRVMHALRDAAPAVRTAALAALARGGTNDATRT